MNGCPSQIDGIDDRSSANVFPQTHHVHGCRRRGHRGRGLFFRGRQRNLQQRLARCQQLARLRMRPPVIGARGNLLWRLARLAGFLLAVMDE